MTGTNRSNKQARALVIFGVIAAATSLPAPADSLLLNGDERLSGTVRAINKDGTVLLDTPLSPDPVALKADSVRKVLFSEKDGGAVNGNCLVTLANGDSLPGVIEEIDGQNLVLASGVTGRMVVPRAAVAALRPGLNHPTVIYSGPDDFEGWSRNKESAEQWSTEKRVFRVQGASSVSRKLELPNQFIIRFKLAWRNSPNFKCSFAAAGDQESDAQDRYYFQFNSAGMELKREAAVGKRYTTITSLNRLPQQFNGRQVTVEIRVDRSERVLQLWLNGELEGKWKDPLAKAPDGGVLVFTSNAGENEMQTISDLEVMDWNLKNDRRPGGERGDKTKDALLGTEGERFSGSLLQTRKSEEGLLYVFKNAFQENPIEVPEAAISAIYLAETPEGADSLDKGVFNLKLQGGGSLRVSECTFTADEVEVVHPLLGSMKLKRAIVAAFERKQAEPEGQKKKP